MGEIHNTQYFRAVQENKMDVSQILEQVYVALTEKGYNPINQIVGYIMSGDPTYITSHKNARNAADSSVMILGSREPRRIRSNPWISFRRPINSNRLLFLSSLKSTP